MENEKMIRNSPDPVDIPRTQNNIKPNDELPL